MNKPLVKRMNEHFQIRDADEKDIDFLVQANIQAGKGNGYIIPYCALFNITEAELRSVLKKIFMEGIADFEFSVQNFMIAEYKGLPVAAYSGWVEGMGGIPSPLLKMSAFRSFLSKEHMSHYESVAHIDSDITIKRDTLTLQLETTYVKQDYRGKGIVALLTNALFKKVKNMHPSIIKAQVQLFKENTAAFLSQSKLGFIIAEEKKSGNPAILDYMPGMTRIKMEKFIS